jgi:hypothetical protein
MESGLSFPDLSRAAGRIGRSVVAAFLARPARARRD